MGELPSRAFVTMNDSLAEDYFAHVIGAVVLADQGYLVARESDVEMIAIGVLPSLVCNRLGLSLDGSALPSAITVRILILRRLGNARRKVLSISLVASLP